MFVDSEPFELPAGVEVAVWRLERAVRDSRSCPIGVFAGGDGKPTLNLYRPDGSMQAVTYIDGEWHELKAVR